MQIAPAAATALNGLTRKLIHSRILLNEFPRHIAPSSNGTDNLRNIDRTVTADCVWLRFLPFRFSVYSALLTIDN